ncbi:MlaD family protein [Pseudomonas sp. GD03944]|uniref:MlaD family protein n=1 Tax=Pseudomonas sp. GD03944 TaxID=2975409 RepID=UPI00244D715A|nr:MlaD family protein [Pseudomonas sp. GD03944]MDH1264540.1 MCE family protein [Pseudomonas sp. GD03944]
MEPRAHHVLIGLFTVITVGAALLFALWLSKAGADREFKEYVVIFNEAVTGLSQGSAVQYSGIKIGDVVSLRLNPNDPRQVRAHVRIVDQTPIKADTRARLTITGITGTAVIQLYSGTPGSPNLEGEGGKPAEIVADPSPLSRLMANSEDLVVSVTRLLDQANRMFSEQNAERVSKTLAHLEQITASVASHGDDIGVALQQITHATREAASLMQEAKRMLATDGQQTLANAERLMASLERSSSTIERLLNDNHEALGNGMRSMGEIGPAISDLRETLGSLRAFSRQLEQDPAGYLLRSEPIKEFQP